MNFERVSNATCKRIIQSALPLALLTLGQQATYAAPVFQPVNTLEETKRVVQFLAGSDGYVQSGTTYMGLAAGQWYPLSYTSYVNYWSSDYVCNSSNGNTRGQAACQVEDIEVYNGATGDYHLWPQMNTQEQLDAANLQFERVDAVTGTNIYDAAASQIALALAAQRGLYNTYNNAADLFGKAASVTNRVAYNTPNSNSSSNNKATGAGFSYGDAYDPMFGPSPQNSNGSNPIREPKLASAFRMVGQQFLSNDPFVFDPESTVSSWVTADLLSPTTAKRGQVSWVDWKPIQGENAWGMLIGPLQAANLQAAAQNQNYVPFNSPAIQNAIYYLFALQRLQSPIGAIYYAPQGTFGNAGNDPSPVGTISTENNASTFAGLRLLSQTLTSTQTNDSSLSTEDRGRLQRALNLARVIMYGGSGPYGNQQPGIINYFKNGPDANTRYAWDTKNKIFYQGGTYANGRWTPNAPDSNNQPNAVDVNTWGVAALGPRQIDSWFGDGAANGLLQSTFQWGGYVRNNQLWGVAFDSLDKNLMSGEWTAGAINALRAVITYYSTSGAGAGKITDAQMQTLVQQEQQMTAGIINLRNDKFKNAQFAGSANGSCKAVNGELGYMYSSDRYYIPFGWWANPICSTASTAWVVMADAMFSPFVLGGSYNFYANQDTSIPNYNSTDPSGPWTPQTDISMQLVLDPSMKANTIEVYASSENAPNISYDKWQNLGTMNVSGGVTTLNITVPKSAYALGISYQPTSTPGAHWGLCNLTQDQLSLFNASTQKIVAAWTNNAGSGSCTIANK